VAIQEIRWDNGGSKPVEDFIFADGNKNVNHHLGSSVLIHRGIISAVNRVEFISDRMSYVTLRGRWCDIIVLNVHAPTEGKSHETKESFHEELERVFDKFSKSHIKFC
jgi:hypothetical protein